MADHRPYDEYGAQDRSRYGREDESGGNRNWDRSRAREQDQGSSDDRDRGPRSRSGGMFGSGSSGTHGDMGAWRSSHRSSGHHDAGHHDTGHHDTGRRDTGRRDTGRQDTSRSDSEFGYDDRHEGLPIDETGRLIASNKVEGTAVYARDGRRIGSIYNFMVDKRSGKVEYAVMTYGGFLGMGTRYYPMPWDILEYDRRLGGYRVDMMERDLERAPSFDRNTEPEFDRRYNDRVRNWYGVGS